MIEIIRRIFLRERLRDAMARHPAGKARAS